MKFVHFGQFLSFRIPLCSEGAQCTGWQTGSQKYWNASKNVGKISKVYPFPLNSLSTHSNCSYVTPLRNVVYPFHTACGQGSLKGITNAYY